MEHALSSLAVWMEYGRAARGNPSEFVWLWANYVRQSGYSTEQNRLAALDAFNKGGANGSL